MNFLMPVMIIMLWGAAEGDVLIYAKYPAHKIIEEFRDMPAHFGDPLPSIGLRGFAINGAPEDGCSPMRPPPNETDNFTGKWIVLVKRYNCTFEQKIRNAQNANYDAVIVYNVNSSDLEPMSAKNPVGIHIPSVFVGEDVGKIILYNYLWDEEYFIILNADLPFNINTHLLLPFAIVVGLCFLIMVAFMIVKCVRERRRMRRHRLPSSVLKKIPTCKFTKGDAYETCAICLDDYLEGEKLRVLPCSHAYHCKCIDPWLTKNRRVCPVCKRRVFGRNEPRTRSDSSSDSEPDDTTPLLNPVANNHGTFTNRPENPFHRVNQETNSINSDPQEIGNVSHNQNNNTNIVFVNMDHQQNENDSASQVSSESERTCDQVGSCLSRSPQFIGNNVLNPHLSGSFVETNEFLNREREGPSTSTTAFDIAPVTNSINTGSLGVIALPNENFKPSSPKSSNDFIV